MKHIKVLSALAAVIFVVASSFTQRVTTDIFRFDTDNYTLNSTTVDDFDKYIAVSSACSLTSGKVCTIVYTGHSQEVGEVLDTDFSASQKTALVNSQTSGSAANSNIKMQP